MEINSDCYIINWRSFPSRLSRTNYSFDLCFLFLSRSNLDNTALFHSFSLSSFSIHTLNDNYTTYYSLTNLPCLFILYLFKILSTQKTYPTLLKELLKNLGFMSFILTALPYELAFYLT